MRFLPHWRKATWSIVIWTAIFALWIFVGISSAPTPTDCGTLDQSTCQAAANIGTGLGVTVVFIIWFIGFIILSLVWFMSRPRYTEFQGRYMKESEARRLSKMQEKLQGKHQS